MTSPEQSGYMTPSEGALAGACFLMTVYGLVVVVASLFADKELVPRESPLLGLVLVVLFGVGAALGGLMARRRS
jgi:hypothetical protein